MLDRPTLDSPAPGAGPSRPIDADEFRADVALAVRLNIDRLPQLKGKGAPRDRAVRDLAIEDLARRIADHLLRANIVPCRAPPAAAHANAAGSP